MRSEQIARPRRFWLHGTSICYLPTAAATRVCIAEHAFFTALLECGWSYCTSGLHSYRNRDFVSVSEWRCGIDRLMIQPNEVARFFAVRCDDDIRAVSNERFHHFDVLRTRAPVKAKEPFTSPTAASPETCGAALSVMNTRGFWAGAAHIATAISTTAERTDTVFMLSSKENRS